MKFPKRFFITGTDTGVGKTVVSAILLAGLSYHYWKPVQCGLLEPSDTDTIKKITGLAPNHFLPEGYSLQTPASPHLAAAFEGRKIEMNRLKIPEDSGSLLVEGAGGVMVPLNDDCLLLDLMKMLDIPVLLVARSGLGTINHTLLSLTALRGNGIDVMGVVLNGERHKHNSQAIEHYGEVPVVAELEPLPALNPLSVMTVFKTIFSGH